MNRALLDEAATTRCAPGDIPPQRGYEPHQIYSLMGLFFGVLFAFLIPPTLIPDESFHFARAYDISEGHLSPRPRDAWGGAELPESIWTIAWYFKPWEFRTTSRVSVSELRTLAARTLDPGERRPDSFWCAGSVYPFLPYLPQASAIALARSLGVRPLGMLYAARLANLIVAVALISFAIRVTPFFKLVLSMVALLPVMVQQTASVSPDAVTFSVALLLLATLFHLASARPGAGRARDVVVTFVSTAVLALSKFPYALLALNFLGVPRAQLGTFRRQWVTAAGLFLVAGLLSLQSARYAQRYIPPQHQLPGYPVSPPLQVQSIRGNPVAFLESCAITVLVFGRDWLEGLGTLGLLNAPIHPLILQVYLTLLVVVALADGPAAEGMPRRCVAIGLVSALLCSGAILTSQYVIWTPVGSNLIFGTQGRYFVPCLPLLLLPLCRTGFEYRGGKRALQRLVTGASMALLLFATATVLVHFYYPEESLLLSTIVPALVCLAGAVAARLFRQGKRQAKSAQRPLEAKA